jgi:UDP-N-acetylglucosamine 2-epimerase (hydrolysing)
MQLGENNNSIFIIGSPDLDFLLKPSSLNIHDVKLRYQIPYDEFGILLYHPVTTEFSKINTQTQILISSLLKSNYNFVVVYPNNDTGYKFIIKNYKNLEGNINFKLFPSIRFEYFVELLKNCNFIIGNSSAGIHEAPSLGIPTINIGNRQSGRINWKSVVNIDYDEKDILNAINFFSKKTRFKATKKFGNGNSYKLFLSSLKKDKLWKTSIQKKFVDFND